jgi:hypothetical protein
VVTGRVRALLAREQGFSLIELVVVSGLMVFVLGISFAAIQLANSTGNFSQRQASYVNDISYPLSHLGSLIMQNSSIDTNGAGLYSLSFLTDRNMDTVRERNVVVATSKGITVDIWLTTPTGVNSTKTAHYMLSPDNSNLAHGQRLFRYWDRYGAEITNLAGAPGNAWSVDIIIDADLAGRTIQGKEGIHFRNRAL